MPPKSGQQAKITSLSYPLINQQKCPEYVGCSGELFGRIFNGCASRDRSKLFSYRIAEWDPNHSFGSGRAATTKPAFRILLDDADDPSNADTLAVEERGYWFGLAAISEQIHLHTRRQPRSESEEEVTEENAVDDESPLIAEPSSQVGSRDSATMSCFLGPVESGAHIGKGKKNKGQEVKYEIWVCKDPLCQCRVRIYPPSTGGASRHLKQCHSADGSYAAMCKSSAHSNKILDEDDAITGTLYMFEEAFQYHFDYAIVVAVEKMPPHKSRQEYYRKHLKGLNQRYVPCAAINVRRIISATNVLMMAKLKAQITNLKEEIGSPCIGIQLDLWKSSSSRDNYMALNGSMVLLHEGRLRLVQLLLAFKRFPRQRHNAINISVFLAAALKFYGIHSIDIEMATPDGAANGVKALK